MEREGISFQHPANFILVGTMNPEEGDLRPQLLDRFAHAVDIEGIDDTVQRVEIVRRRLDYERDPEAFYAAWFEDEHHVSEEIERARVRLALVTYANRDIYLIAHLTAQFKVDGHRADIVILKTAQANAAYEGHLQVTEHDIMVGAELALPHRLKRQPFQDASLQPQQLQQRMEQAQEQAEMMEMQLAQADAAGNVKKKRVS